jgi:hypothetical protein
MVDRAAGMPRERIAELVAAASYGSVLVLAALSVIGVRQISLGYGAEIVFGVGVATWLAHLFAELLGGHVLHQEPLHRREIGAATVNGSPIVVATLLPGAVLLFARVDVLSDTTAKLIAIVVALLQLLGIGIFVGRVAPSRPGARWLFAGTVACIGLVVVVVTVFLGH